MSSCFLTLPGMLTLPLPGQPVPMLDHSLSEKFHPDVQAKLALVKLEAISSCSAASYLGEEANTPSCYKALLVVVEGSKVPLEPLFLQAKQPEFFQPLSVHYTSFVALL